MAKVFASSRVLEGKLANGKKFARKPTSNKSTKVMTGDFAWQDDATKVLTKNRLTRLLCPTGSGKTTIGLAAAYARFQRDERCLIVTPQTTILNGFLKINITRKNGEHYSKRAAAYVTGDLSVNDLALWLTEEYPDVAVTTGASFVAAWEKVPANKRKAAAKNLWVAFDEAHHLANDDEFNTQLGLIAEELVALGAGVCAISATHFRGDGADLFKEETDKLLVTYERPFIKHWEFLGLGSLDYRCIGWDDDADLMDQLVESICSEPDEHHIVCLPADGRGVRAADPMFPATLIKRLTKRGRKVLDLVHDGKKQDNKVHLQNKAYDKYDVLVSCNIMREGNDWEPASRVHDLAPSRSTTRTVQTIGRMTRAWGG